MTNGHGPDLSMPSSIAHYQMLSRMLLSRTLLKVILGPLVALSIGSLPLAVNPTAHLALTIVSFMIVYWITEPIDLNDRVELGNLHIVKAADFLKRYLK